MPLHRSDLHPRYQTLMKLVAYMPLPGYDLLVSSGFVHVVISKQKENTPNLCSMDLLSLSEQHTMHVSLFFQK